MANSNETSRTESEIMGDSIHSTPAPSKRVEENDIIRMMKLLFNEQNIKFDKFNEKLNQFDVQFSEIKNENKKQNFNKRIDEMHARFDKTGEKIVALAIEKFDRQKNKVDENYESKMGVENSSCLLYTSRCV